MKKLFLVAGIVAVLALIPLSSLMATQDEAPATTDKIVLVSLDEALAAKVDVCHRGRVISVSENAVPAHIRPGDPENFDVNPDGTCSEADEADLCQECLDAANEAYEECKATFFPPFWEIFCDPPFAADIAQCNSSVCN